MTWNLPLTGYTKHLRAGRVVFQVDTAKASYHGRPWLSLGAFGKRKYENLLFIKHATENPAFHYV